MMGEQMVMQEELFYGFNLERNVPDHSTFSKTRHGRFRESDLLRELFETVLRRCMVEGLVSGDGFAVDASLIVADTGYGSAEMLNWLVHERGIEPHIPVFDKSKRKDGTFSREDFTYDHGSDAYSCPGGKLLRNNRRSFTEPRTGVTKADTRIYRASKRDCDVCPLKPRCCPTQPMRKIPRSIHEGARDMARDIAKTEAYETSRRQRKKVEMLFAHLKRILKLGRLRLRGPCGARDECLLAATAQNLRKLAKICTQKTPIPAA